jgi:membrane protein YdbS with pleckstrin-like domain
MMSQALARASEWLYHGVWRVLVRWFRVPAEPPTLPAVAEERIQAYRPAPGFLRYMKFQFWVLLTVIDVGLGIGWLVLLIAVPVAGMVIAPLALAVIILPDILAYVAIHLRYDTTWYVFSDRSLRIRRGIWIIHETTITFENIQQVTVDQGPLQRWFGIANVVVKTAGGGSGAGQGHEAAALMSGHHGLIEGIDNAAEIRDLIMNRLRQSQSAGLGDDSQTIIPGRLTGFHQEHIALLREIRDAVGELARR